MKKQKQENDIIVGLDVGTTKICVIVARVKDDKNVDIIGVGKGPSSGLHRGIVVNPTKAEASIRFALENAEQNCGTPITSVSVGVAGHHIRCINTSSVVGINNADRTIHQSDIDRIIEQAKLIRLPSDTTIVDVIPQEFIVDDRDKYEEPPIGMFGIKLEVKANIITGILSSIEDLSVCVQNCGVEIDEIVLEPIASSHAVLDDTEKKVGVAMLDIGGGTTDVAVFKKGVLKYTAGIGLAGNLVTDDIVEGLGILNDEAEKIKKEYGYALVDEILNDDNITVRALRGQIPRTVKKSVLARIIQARMQDIFELSAIEIGNSQIANELHAGVVITGGGSLVRGAKELAEYILKSEVNLGTPQGISGGLIKEVESPIYATGVGLVLHRLKNLNKGKVSVFKQIDKTNKQNIFSNVKKWFDEL